MAGPITRQGSSTGNAPDYSTFSKFKTSDFDPANIGSGPGTFKFPLDDVSAGNFWTRLNVNSWMPVRPKEEMVERQGHKLNRHHIANIWLPMPANLGTTYNQNYTETENMMVEGGKGLGNIFTSEGRGTYWDHADAVTQGIKNELWDWGFDILNANNSGKMNLGSVLNQHMGLVYDGAALRKHTLAWKMTPKSKEEQAAINKVVFALKKYSAPIILPKYPGQGPVYHATSREVLENATNEVEESNNWFYDAIEGTANWLGGTTIGRVFFPGLPDPTPDADVADTMRQIGRLGIPATINAEFWYGNAVNPNLFQIKDSFITSVAVNYTPSGGWNAHQDGAPIETELTLTLAETSIISIDEIHSAGGY